MPFLILFWWALLSGMGKAMMGAAKGLAKAGKGAATVGKGAANLIGPTGVANAATNVIAQGTQAFAKGGGPGGPATTAAPAKPVANVLTRSPAFPRGGVAEGFASGSSAPEPQAQAPTRPVTRDVQKPWARPGQFDRMPQSLQPGGGATRREEPAAEKPVTMTGGPGIVSDFIAKNLLGGSWAQYRGARQARQANAPVLASMRDELSKMEPGSQDYIQKQKEIANTLTSGTATWEPRSIVEKVLTGKSGLTERTYRTIGHPDTLPGVGTPESEAEWTPGEVRQRYQPRSGETRGGQKDKARADMLNRIYERQGPESVFAAMLRHSGTSMSFASDMVALAEFYPDVADDMHKRMKAFDFTGAISDEEAAAIRRLDEELEAVR